MDISEYKLLRHEEIKGKKYIELRLGKHRKKGMKSTSVFFQPDVFAILEGIIWDKYREYSPTTTNAISKRDWMRLLEGFDDFTKESTTIKTQADLKRVLMLRSRNMLQEDLAIPAFITQINSLLEDIKTWIIKELESEDYITICV